MKIRHMTSTSTRRSRLARLALSSTLVCGLGVATAHSQEIGDDVGGDAGSTVEDRLSPGQGQEPTDASGALQRGAEEAGRALSEGQDVEQSLRRGAGEAVQGAGEAISGQQSQDRRLYRDDQGRTFYRDDQGRQIYVQGDAEARMQARGGQADAGQQATLGVAIQDSDQGVEVLSIQPNTAAASAGLQQGDRILEFNGEPVQSTDWLGQRITSFQPGEEVNMTIMRNGERQEMSATLQAGQQRYQARRPEMRGDQQGDLSGLRQQVQQLQREIESLRQQIDQIKANGGAQADVQTEAQGDAATTPGSDQPLRDQDPARQTEDQGELDLDAGLNTEGEAGAEAGAEIEAEGETQTPGAAVGGQQNPGNDNN